MEHFKIPEETLNQAIINTQVIVVVTELLCLIRYVLSAFSSSKLVLCVFYHIKQ